MKWADYSLSIAGAVKLDNMGVGMAFSYVKTDKFLSNKGLSFIKLNIGVQSNAILPELTVNPSEPQYLPEFLQRSKRKQVSGLVMGISLLNVSPQKLYYNDAKTQQIQIPQKLNGGFNYYFIQSDYWGLELNGEITKYLVHNQDNFIKSWFTSWKDKVVDEVHLGAGLDVTSILKLYFGWERRFDLNENSPSFGVSIGLGGFTIDVARKKFPFPSPDNRKNYFFGLTFNR